MATLSLEALPLHDAATQSLSYFRRDALIHTGSLIAANARFVCYAIKGNGIIRAIHRPSESLCLLRGHSKEVVDMKLVGSTEFTNTHHDLLASVANDQTVIIWRLSYDGAEVKQEQTLTFDSPFKTPVGGFDRIALRAPTDALASMAVAALGGDRLCFWSLDGSVGGQLTSHGCCEIENEIENGGMEGQRRIISCMAFAEAPHTHFAAGFTDGTVFTTSEATFEALGSVEAPSVLSGSTFVAHAAGKRDPPLDGVSLVSFFRRGGDKPRLLTCGSGNWEVKIWSDESAGGFKEVQALSMPASTPNLRATPLLATYAGLPLTT